MHIILYDLIFNQLLIISEVPKVNLKYRNIFDLAGGSGDSETGCYRVSTRLTFIC